MDTRNKQHRWLLHLLGAAILLLGLVNSHGDRYLGMTAAMTQAPVPTAMV